MAFIKRLREKERLRDCVAAPGGKGKWGKKKFLGIFQTSVLKKLSYGQGRKGLKWEEGLTAGRNSLCTELEMGPKQELRFCSH